MAKILVYTSPALGHLFPALGPALELARRDHDVHVVTLASELQRVRDLGLGASAMDPAIEAEVMDDFAARTPIGAVKRAVRTFARRAARDGKDLQAAIQREQPDVLLIDTNCFGARTAAEASGIPWCVFQPYFSPLPSPEVPPFGPGFPLATNALGRLRDRVLRPVVCGMFEKLTLDAVGSLRSDAGLPPLKDLRDFYTRPNKTLYFTTAELDYPRSDWPDSFVMCGPATWEPDDGAPAWLDAVDRPIVLVTCSTEAQNDRPITEGTLEALADAPLYVVATTAAEDPSTFRVPANARIEKFVPHGPVLDRALAVICHGGMGITQKALAKGVPVCVVPFGRDQLEVGRRVEQAKVGLMLNRGQLTPRAIFDAVQSARDLKSQALQMAKAFERAGGAARAADEVIGLLGSRLVSREA